MSKHLIALLLLAASASVGCGAAEDPIYADTHPLSVPVVVTPSIQIASGQKILYKASNISMGPASFRLMVYNETNGIPEFYKDFPKVPPGNTVTYVYTPPMTTLAIDEQTSVEVPQAVRATFAPIPQVDHNVMRQVVANVEIIRVQPGANGAAATIDTPVVVPLSHCNFEPRGRVPYIEGGWYWNCAPGIYPLKRNEGNEGS